MDSKIVNKSIREKVKPVLKEYGFTEFTSRCAWRYSGNRIHVINFQSFNSYNADCMGCTTYSFAVNFGCYLSYMTDVKKYLKEKNGRLLPMDYHCPFRSHLERGFEQKELKCKGIWFIDDKGQYIASALDDVIEQIQRTAMPWFERLETDKEILHVLENVEEDNLFWGFGSKPSPHRNLLRGYLALEMNDKELAIKKFKEVIASGCYKDLIGDINRLLASLE